MKATTRAYKDATRIFGKKLAKSVTENPMSFYLYIRSKAKTKDTVGPLTDKTGKVVKEEIDV